MFVPAIVQRFIDKAPEAGADVVCLDLEDSVPPDKKDDGRRQVGGAIESMARTGYALYVRVNALATGLAEAEVRGVVRPGLDGIILPKSESGQDLTYIEGVVAAEEMERGIPPGSVALMPLIESAKGVMEAYDICRSSARISGAIFGAEDFAADMGIQRTIIGEEIFWARSIIAIACRAAGVASIDTPATDYSDEQALIRDMKLAKSIGFTGKLCIHPSQVAMANQVFSPSAEELVEALVLVEVFERDALGKGLAAIAIDGKMVDTPMYERAKRIVEWAGEAES